MREPLLYGVKRNRRYLFCQLRTLLDKCRESDHARSAWLPSAGARKELGKDRSLVCAENPVAIVRCRDGVSINRVVRHH